MPRRIGSRELQHLDLVSIIPQNSHTNRSPTRSSSRLSFQESEEEVIIKTNTASPSPEPTNAPELPTISEEEEEIRNIPSPAFSPTKRIRRSPPPSSSSDSPPSPHIQEKRLEKEAATSSDALPRSDQTTQQERVLPSVETVLPSIETFSLFPPKPLGTSQARSPTKSSRTSHQRLTNRLVQTLPSFPPPINMPAGESQAGPSRGPAPLEQPVAPYSNNNYRLDAAFILAVYERLVDGQHEDLRTIITDQALGMARGVSHLLSVKHRQEVRRRTEERIRDAANRTPEALRKIVKTFMKGPTETEDDKEDRPPPSAPQPSSTPRDRLQPPLETGPTNPPRAPTQHRSVSYDEEIPRHFTPQHPKPGSSYYYVRPQSSRYQPPPRELSVIGAHRSQHRYSPPRMAPYPPSPTRQYAHGAAPGYPGDSDGPSSDEDPYRPRKERNNRQVPDNRYGNDLYRNDRRQEQNRPRHHRRRLKPEDIGLYDGLSSVNLFVRRITSMVNRYGEEEVLSVLPLCLRDLTRIWYDTLTADILDRMDQDVDLWIIQLRARFQRNPIEAEEDADRCKFVFGREDKMDLRTYVTQKQNLLLEAGIEEPRQIMNRLWRDLDPILQMNVAPDPYMTLEMFIQTLYFQEYAARRLWQQMQGTTRFTASTSNYGRMRSPESRYGVIQPRQILQPSTQASPQPRYPRLLTNNTKTDRQLPDQIRGRPRYPCTHCGSSEHLDNACDKRPAGEMGRGLPRPSMRVHFTKENDEQKENYPVEGYDTQDIEDYQPSKPQSESLND